MHANAGSLLRHVRADGRLVHRPGKVWTRRSAARIPDASLGILAAAVAQRKDRPSQALADYAERHAARALTPVAVMAGVGAGDFKPRQVIDTIRIIRETGTYLWSGQAASEPVGVRQAHIRDQFAAALHVAIADIPPGSLDPFLDHVAITLAREAPGGE